MPPAGPTISAAKSGASGASPDTPARDLERFIGLTVLGRAGIAALVVAAAYFGQLGWTRLGPVGRITLIYVAAALMLAAGFALRQRVARRFTATLFGGSIALTYVAGALARLRYELVDSSTALALLVGSMVLGQWLGRVLKLEMMAVIALAGGYAAPVLVGEPSQSPTPFLTFLVALHSWAAWVDYRWAWHRARGLAVASTAILTLGWFVTNRNPPVLDCALNLEFVLLGLCLPELITAFRHGRLVDLRWRLIHLGTWVVHFWLVSISALRQELQGFGLAAAAGLVPLGIALRRRRPDHRAGGQLAGVGLWAMVFAAQLVWDLLPGAEVADAGQKWGVLTSLLAATGTVFALRRFTGVGDLATLWAATLATLVVLGQRTPPDAMGGGVALVIAVTPILWGRHPAASCAALLLGAILIWFEAGATQDFFQPGQGWLALSFAGLAAWSAGAARVGTRRGQPVLPDMAVGLLAFTGLTWFFVTYIGTSPGTPGMVFLNLRFASALAILTGIVSAHRGMRRIAKPFHLYLLGATALALTWLAGRIELVDAVRTWDPRWRGAVTSIYSTGFAGALLAAGFWRHERLLRWTGLIGFLLVTAKVALVDLASLDTPLRVLVTGVLGGVLLIGAYTYARLSTARS